MKKIESWIITFLLKAKIGKWIGQIFSKLTGWKSYITLLLIAIIKFAIYLGYIPDEFKELANEIIISLYGALTIAVGDKFKRYWEAIKRVTDEVVDKR